MSEDFAKVSKVDRFTLHEQIGAGASSVVFRATDMNTREFAVKIAHCTLLSDPPQFARIERECVILAQLAQSNIVKLVAHGVLDDGRPWYAMQYVHGTSLREYTFRRLSLADCWKLIRPIAVAVHAMHVKNVIHRDIKPDNIVVNKAGEPWLIDFGLSRPVAVGSTPITAEGTALGTPAYMAPEQWWNQDVGPACDQYALGCVFFELANGQTPFVEQSWAAWTEAHLHKRVPTLQNATVDQQRWIEKSLEKSATDRFVSLVEWLIEGDRIFAVALAPKTRWVQDRLLPALVVSASLCVFAAMGHGGVHSPRELCRLAGFGVWLTLGLTAAAVLAALRGRLNTSLVPSLVAAGTLGAITGWSIVLRFVVRVVPEQKFVVLHDGLLEADINRAFALIVGMGVLLAANMHAAPAKRWAASGALLAAVLVSAGDLTDSLLLVVTWVLWLFPFGVWLISERGTHQKLLDRVGALLLAGVMFVGAMAVHLGGLEALVWRDQRLHAARVLTLAALERDRGVLLGLALMLIVLTLGASRWAASRLSERSDGLRSQALQWLRGSRLSAGLLLLCLGLNVYLSAQIRSARAQVRESYTSQFAIFQRLNPPRCANPAGLYVPHLAASVQIAQDVIAVDRTVVLRLSALETERGQASLSSDLAHRLAADRAGEQAGTTLSLLVDRQTPWRLVHIVMRLALDLGASDFELLIAKGDTPQWNVWAPQESVLLLPSDFVAVTVRCAVSANALRQRGEVSGSSRTTQDVIHELTQRSDAQVGIWMRSR